MYHLVRILMDFDLKKVLIFFIFGPYILGKSPYKHQNETIGPYLSLILGIFWGVGEVGELIVPSPHPLFSQKTPKNPLNNLWTNKELLILVQLWQF